MKLIIYLFLAVTYWVFLLIKYVAYAVYGLIESIDNIYQLTFNWLLKND